MVPPPNAQVRLKRAGNIFEIRHMTRQAKATIQKIDREHYMVLSEDTGEVKTCQHNTTRADDLQSVRQSLARLRDLLNANVTDPRKARWLTLTYAENMTDPVRLYKDFHNFLLRLRYHLERNRLPKVEYIAAAEPQARGAWHLHVVLIFAAAKAPFILNETIERIWGHGFTKIKKLDNVDNVGLYLTAYLCDLEVTDALGNAPVAGRNIKGVELLDENGERFSKAVVKGSRLYLYPRGFRIYRKSKGIVDPEIESCTYAEALEKVGHAKLTFERTIQIIDEQGRVANTISYRHYNRKTNEAKGAKRSDG